MSTIQSQVKKRFFERFRLPGFVVLDRTSGLLNRFMEKVGLIEIERLDVQVIPKESDNSEQNVVSIKLGKFHRIFNPHHDYYFYGSCSNSHVVEISYLEISPTYIHIDERSIKTYRNNKVLCFYMSLNKC